MSFSGDLQHLPIVDIIQLIHTTRKSGSLRLTGSRGESRLVFNDGYIISANHSNNSVRLGQVLLGMNAVSRDDLDAALDAQRLSGANRQPLIATLIESGKIEPKIAYKGLETLIVMTIIDILTWDGGTFTVDVGDVSISDEYRYFPETLHQEFYASTQSILMDALRIFDEKMRDGEIDAAGIFPDEGEEIELPPAAAAPTESIEGDDAGISADLLGLDELDRMEKKIPDVFKGLSSPAQPRQSLPSPDFGEIDSDCRQRILAYIAGLSVSQPQRSTRTVILYSRDRLLTGALSALCRQIGLSLFTLDEESSLDLLIEQSLGRDHTPILLIDAPEEEPGFLADDLAALCLGRMARYPDLVAVRLALPEAPQELLSMLDNGLHAAFPKYDTGDLSRIDTGCIALLEALRLTFGRIVADGERKALERLPATLTAFDGLDDPTAIAQELYAFAAPLFPRSQLFFVTRDGLVSDRGHDIEHPDRPPLPPRLRLDPAAAPTFARILTAPAPHFGLVPELEPLFARYSEAPRSRRALILALILDGRCAALFYADFGAFDPGRSYVPLLESVARTAAMAIEKVRYRQIRAKSV